MRNPYLLRIISTSRGETIIKDLGTGIWYATGMTRRRHNKITKVFHGRTGELLFDIEPDTTHLWHPWDVRENSMTVHQAKCLLDKFFEFKNQFLKLDFKFKVEGVLETWDPTVFGTFKINKKIKITESES